MEKREEWNTIRYLRIYFYVLFLMMAVAVAVLLGKMEAFQGMHDDSVTFVEYVSELVVVAMTLLCVPWSLKLMRIKGVRKKITRENADYLEHYKRFNLLRLFFPFFVMSLGFILYVFWSRQTFLFCGLIGLLVVLYCWPSLARLRRETTESEEKE